MFVSRSNCDLRTLGRPEFIFTLKMSLLPDWTDITEIIMCPETANLSLQSATNQGLVLTTKASICYSQLESFSDCQSLHTVRCAEIGLADMSLEGEAFDRERAGHEC